MRFQPITVNSTSGAIWDAYDDFTMMMEWMPQDQKQDGSYAAPGSTHSGDRATLP
jgi:hypothetical protein